MGKPARVLFSMALLMLVMCVGAKDARAQLGDPDYTTLEELATTYGWANAFGWNTTANPCPNVGPNWSGITCNQGRVISITADCGATLLNAALPEILGQLTNLQTLQVKQCGLTGPIPDIFASLPRLSKLTLANNTLSGTIPNSIATLPNAAIVALDDNLLTGAVPDFPDSSSIVIRLAGNFLTSIPGSWTTFNRDLSYNCYPTLPPTCDSQSTLNECSPNREDCPATMFITKVSGDGQWAQINTIYANPLVVSVTDLLGNPLTGVTVTFSGPGIVTTTANSDSNGQASAVVEAGSTAGGNTVTASAGSVPMIAFGLTAGDNAACNTRIAVTNNAASGPGTLQDALADVCPGGTVDLTPIAGQTITLPAGTQSYNFNGRLYIATDVTIQGAGATISGGGATRIFFVQNGNVTLNNLTLTNGAGQGGTSQYGGSGAGLGGAIFENNGNLTLNGVVLSGNQAVGGSTDSSGSITGGGFGGGSSSGDLGGAAGPADGAGGVLDGVGGQGGFGTGGGPGNANLFGTYPGGLGGFGGGGGGWVIIQPQGDILGNSGFGGYGGSQGTSPTSSTSGIGGSGAGFGGAIFVRNGNLNLANVTFTNNSAIGGTGAQGKGASLFMYNGANLNMVPNTVTYSGDVAAAAGFPGQGYSGDPYDNNNTCPGVDTVDICGIVPSNTLTAAVLGGGSIIDTTGLIDCPSVNCTALFQTSATLTAVPAAGSYFTGWSGGCPGTGTCAVSLSGGSALVTATFTAIGTVSTTSGTPQSTMTGTQFASPLVVTVADVNSNPVPGATVVFTTPNSGASATLSAPAVTNAQGQTSVTANANSTPGSYTVTATVAGVAGSANFSLTNIGAPATLAISGGSNQSTAPGTAFATNLQVTATDLAGDPVARVQVIFTANTSPDGAAGMFACSSANVDTEFTNGSGIAQASVLTANGSTGKFTVTAALGSLSQTFTLTNGSSSNVSLSASQFISVLSQPVTLTASLTPSAATGNVTFYDGTNILGVAPVSNGVATLTTSFLPADTNALTALYDGAAPYAPVLSNVQNVLVTPYPSPSLGAPAIYPAAETPMQMVVGDFNGDGIPDLLMFGLNGSSFTVLLGNGDGTFAGSAPQPPTSGECTSAASAITCVLNSPFSAAVGDFNGDGKLDVAFSAPPGLNVLLGNGDGTFQAPLTYVSPMESYLAVADLNGDGMADLVMAGPDPSIQTWLGNGDGTFQPPMATISVGNNVSNVVIGDFNNDGIPDVAVSSFEGSVSVLLGNGDGTLQSGASYQVGYGSSIATGHFYSAANLDLVVANTNQNSLSLLSNAGNGTFGSAVQINLPQGAQAQSVAVGDFNGDRIADLAVGTANGVLVLLGSGGGLFGNPASYTIATGAVFPTVAIADFNRDGHTDVAAISQALTGAAVLLGAIPGESMNSSQGNNQSTGAGTAFATNLQVAITDGNLFPVPNVTVTFTTPSSGASGTFAGGVNTATTNASGIATAAVLTANTTAGGYQVTASVPGLTAVNFSLTNNASAPANIAPTSGSGQSANVNTAFATPLTVTVTDTYGNPVPKATVTFTPPAQSGASVTFAGGINIASTNANGVATSAPIAANGIAGGPYNVAASVNSITTNFQLTNVPVLTGLGLAPLSGTAGIGTRYTVTATAIGSGNTPLSGVNVIFSVTSGPNTKAAGDGVTNGNGQASLTYTGNGGPGTDVLQASAGGIQSNTVQVSWETPDSLSMTAILPSNESYGTTLPVLESATLTWSGKAKAPTGAIAFSSTASGSFEAKPLCITLGDSMTCGQTFNPSATDVPGTYTFSAGYAGDINYGPSGTTVTNNFSIAPQQPVVTILNVTPPSESYGHGVGVAINASLNWIGGGAAPTAANSQWLTFSSTAAGSFGAVTCSGAKSIQCGVEFTPAATDPAGSYTIAASYAGDNNYKAATSPQRNNFTINADAPLVSLMPTAVTVEKGSTTPVPITASFTGAGSSDAAPDGAVTFRAATGSFSGQSCSANGDVLTCKVNYQPSGKLSVSTYQNYLTATMGASGDYKTASGHANLVVQAK